MIKKRNRYLRGFVIVLFYLFMPAIFCNAAMTDTMLKKLVVLACESRISTLEIGQKMELNNSDNIEEVIDRLEKTRPIILDSFQIIIKDITTEEDCKYAYHIYSAIYNKKNEMKIDDSPIIFIIDKGYSVYFIDSSNFVTDFIHNTFVDLSNQFTRTDFIKFLLKINYAGLEGLLIEPEKYIFVREDWWFTPSIEESKDHFSKSNENTIEIDFEVFSNNTIRKCFISVSKEAISVKIKDLN